MPLTNTSQPRLRSIDFFSAHWPWFLGCVLLLASSLWTASVWIQNRAVLSALQRRPGSVVEAGAYIAHVTGITIDAKRASHTLDSRSSGSLLFALSIDCEFCSRNMPTWKRLSTVAQDLGIQVIWVSRDSFDRVEAMKALPEPLVIEPAHSTYQSLALALVPRTIIVNEDGVVTEVHTGVLDSSTETRLAEGLMGVATPSIARMRFILPPDTRYERR